jgi:Xaa-Pro dipeptidase
VSTAGPARDGATRLPGAEFAARDERLRDDMGRRGLRMLVATSPADIYWLTGFDSFSSYQLQAAVVHPGTVRPILWVHEMEAGYAREVGWCDDVVPWRHSEADGSSTSAAAALGSWLAGMAGTAWSIGVDQAGAAMTGPVRDALAEALPAAHLVDSSDLIGELRVIKSDQELTRIRAAAAHADAAMTAVSPNVRSGTTELELLTVIQSTLNERGSEHPAVPHVVLSGDRCVFGHQPPSARVIEAPDRVVVEVIGVVARYHANISRTVAVGRSTALFEDACAAVIEAVCRCTDAAGPGVPGAHLDDLSREVTDRFDGNRRHRVGYGLEAGFPPSMTGLLSISRGNDRRLEPGMVIAVAPYLYFDDEPPDARFAAIFGHDIEITATGARSLTSVPLEVVRVN